MLRVPALVFTLLLAACAQPATPLQRTLTERTAHFELAVARGPSVARSAGVLDLARRRAHVERSAGLAEGGPAVVPFDLREWLDGSSIDIDDRGRIERVVFRQRDVTVTLLLSDFGAAVRSGGRGT